jgi:phosphoribosylformylglycinamidine synthase PurS subunit
LTHPTPDSRSMLTVHVLVHLRPDILDVQGQAITQAVRAAGHGTVASIRAGKSFMLEIDAASVEEARPEIERLCTETLSNPLLEDFTWSIVDSKEAAR